MTSWGSSFDRWPAPRREMSWRPGGAPIDGPVAKLGGQPFWIGEPFWPVSRGTGEPMTFIGQFPLPGSDAGLAQLFLSDEDGTFDLEGGENALLIHPGGRVPPFVNGEARRTGPTLWRRGADWFAREPVELHLDLNEPAEEPPDLECRSYVGGEPLFWQPDAPPEIDDSWRFFFQLDGAEGVDGDAFALNFGGGTGYAFLSRDLREGRFCWDCV